MNKKEILEEITEIMESNISNIESQEFDFEKNGITYITEKLTDEDQVKTLKYYDMFIEYKGITFCVEYYTVFWDSPEVTNVSISENPYLEIKDNLMEILEKYIKKDLLQNISKSSLDNMLNELITTIKEDYDF